MCRSWPASRRIVRTREDPGGRLAHLRAARLVGFDSQAGDADIDTAASIEAHTRSSDVHIR